MYTLITVMLKGSAGGGGGGGGGDHLNDCEAKGFLEGDIGKDSAGGVGQAVDVRNVHLAVLLGVGDAAIQIMTVHQLQHLSQNLAAAGCHAVNILPVSLHHTHDFLQVYWPSAPIGALC